ncbi:hypothetical protein D7Z54_15410 [Salibacterium salarium]|uniref:Uncharacterized protein n=1 Tax=Salibacterium salarium TaxID=284579 RepID=A0A3R9WSC8_9BACI|nr:hypothetical protein D7Z54_15410 [Salibacterium salarium]
MSEQVFFIRYESLTCEALLYVSKAETMSEESVASIADAKRSIFKKVQPHIGRNLWLPDSAFLIRNLMISQSMIR